MKSISGSHFTGLLNEMTRWTIMVVAEEFLIMEPFCKVILEFTYVLFFILLVGTTVGMPLFYVSEIL